MSNAGNTNRTCPSLGLMDDAETSLAFPSIWNCCYRSRPIAPPKLKYQEEFCLCENHSACPLFLNEKTTPLPGHIRAPRSRVSGSKKVLWRTLLVVLIVIGVIFVMAWGGKGQILFSPFGIEKETVTAVATIEATISPAPTASFSPTLTRTATVPKATATAPSSSHQLDMPIGTDLKFLIHSVLEGENLDQYAPKYNTSVEAIVAVNHDLKPPVWVGTLVVIPMGFTDVSDLPSFETYMITEAGMTVDLLAQKFDIDPLDLKQYNSIRDGESLLVGDWLLIPHKKTVP
jgi:LysM repeat protein